MVLSASVCKIVSHRALRFATKEPADSSSAGSLISPSLLLQLHRPVRRIQELFPARILRIGQADVDDRAALGLDRLGDQVHTGLLGRAAALLYVALHAAADDVVPRRAAALALGDHVIQ